MTAMNRWVGLSGKRPNPHNSVPPEKRAFRKPTVTKILPFRPRHTPATTSANLFEFLRDAIDRAEQDTAALKPIHTARLHRLEIQLLTRNRHFADLVRQRVFSSDTDFASREICRVAVLSPEDSSLPPPPAWGEPIFHAREFEKLLEDSPLRASYFHDLRVWQIYDHEQKFGLLWLTGSHNYCDWEPAAPLRTFLHWTACFQDMRLAHAGVLGKGGVGVLLAGSGGSGKSGTVIGGIAHGLQSVGDDYVLLEADALGVFAYPLFQTLKQDLSGLRRLGLETRISQTRSTNWQDKFEFTSEEIGGQSLAAQLKIRAILIPKIVDAANSTISPISPQRAMLALAPTGLFQLPGERTSGVRFFTDLVRRLPCFELALSRDPANVSRTLEAFIDEGLSCN